MAAASLAIRWVDFDFLLEIKGPFLSGVQGPSHTNTFSAFKALGTEAVTSPGQRATKTASQCSPCWLILLPLQAQLCFIQPTRFLWLTYPLALYLLVWSQSLLGSRLLMFFGFCPAISSRSILTKSEGKERDKKVFWQLQSLIPQVFYVTARIKASLSVYQNDSVTAWKSCCYYVFNC